MAKPTLSKLKVDTSNSGVVAGGMVLAMLAVVGSFLISKHLVGDISFNAKLLSRKKAANVQLEQNVNALGELQSNFARLEQDGPQPSAVLSALPLNPAYPELSKELEAMAAIAGVQLSSVTLTDSANNTGAAVTEGATDPAAIGTTGEGGEVTGGSTPPVVLIPLPQEVQFQVVATARDYGDLRKFLRNIEVGLRPMKVVSFEITNNEGAVSIDFILASHYQQRSEVGDQKEVITDGDEQAVVTGANEQEVITE